MLVIFSQALFFCARQTICAAARAVNERLANRREYSFQYLISEVQIPCIHLVKHVGNVFVIAICENNVAYFLELVKVSDDAAVEEAVLFHRRLVDHDLYAFCFDALH